jgi:hypothetical protein
MGPRHHPRLLPKRCVAGQNDDILTGMRLSPEAISAKEKVSKRLGRYLSDPQNKGAHPII